MSSIYAPSIIPMFTRPLPLRHQLVAGRYVGASRSGSEGLSAWSFGISKSGVLGFRVWVWGLGLLSSKG